MKCRSFVLFLRYFVFVFSRKSLILYELYYTHFIFTSFLLSLSLFLCLLVMSATFMSTFHNLFVSWRSLFFLVYFIFLYFLSTVFNFPSGCMVRLIDWLLDLCPCPNSLKCCGSYYSRIHRSHTTLFPYVSCPIYFFLVLSLTVVWKVIVLVYGLLLTRRKFQDSLLMKS